jgi:hypothetical protein
MTLKSRLSGERKAGRILRIIFGNALPLTIALYGLKCIVTLNGHLTEPGSREILHTFHLAPVRGTAAVMTGFGDIALALFGYLSCGSPPAEDRSRPWRMARAILRWGSLAATFVLWHQAHKLRLKMS